MKDRVTSAIRQYDEYVKKTGRGEFYAKDIEVMAARVKEKRDKDGKTAFADTVPLCMDAMAAGFMFGYRCAQRDAKRK